MSSKLVTSTTTTPCPRCGVRHVKVLIPTRPVARPFARAEEYAWSEYSMWQTMMEGVWPQLRSKSRRPSLEQLDNEPTLFGE